MPLPRLTIIGGGVCGGTIARLLSPHVTTTVFEKSGRLSGRVASLLFRDTVVDHGAPYFTLCPATHTFLSDVLGADLLPLPGCILDVDATGAEHATAPDTHTTLFVRGSANTLGARLLADLPGVSMRTREPVIRDTRGHLATASGAPLPRTDATAVAIPLPQASALFPQLLPLPSTRDAYQPLLVAALAYPARRTPSDGVFARRFHDNTTLSLIAHESLKPRGAREDLFIVHASPSFSRRRLDDDPLHWGDDLRVALETHWPGLRGPCAALFPKRWRYAKPDAHFPDSPSAADVRASAAAAARSRRVFFACDALAPAPASVDGVRGAVLSGAAAAAAVATALGIAVPARAAALLRAPNGGRAQ